MTRKTAINFRVWSYDFQSDWKWIIENAKKLGYDALELPPFSPDARISEALHDSGLVPIIALGGTPEADVSSTDSAIITKGRERIMGAVDLCSKLGGSLVIGPMYSFAGKLEYFASEHEKREKQENLAGIFADLALYADKQRVRLALEPLCRYDNSIINTVEDGLALVNSAGRENLGLLLDTFHMNIEEKSISEAIRAAGRAGSRKLFHLHACENDRGVLGTGLIDWRKVSSALDAVGYNGYVSIESFAPERPPSSSNFKIWRKLAQTQDEFAQRSIQFLKANLA